MRRERSPAFKLLIAGLVGLALAIPLFALYALVWDRQSQSETARATNVQGWGAEQTFTGPVMVIPYTDESIETIRQNGRDVSRTVKVQRQLFLSPVKLSVDSKLEPQRLKRSIYTSVVYGAEHEGVATFALPADFARYGVDRNSLRLDSAELRFGVSDPRGLQPDGRVTVNGDALRLKPGKGLAATGGSGFYAFFDWTGTPELNVEFAYSMRGNGSVSIVPRAGQTVWTVRSDWPHPSFTGDFSPKSRKVSEDGFEARYDISNLALGQDLVLTEEPGPPVPVDAGYRGPRPAVASGVSQSTTVSLIEPVDLYSQVDRSVKYGFLFIGFTFMAFLMFDVVAGARVAAAEYLLVGAGLVLFFVLLLAFAEIIGFLWAYLVAAGAITGLLTSYSAAVLKSWRRAYVIAGLLLGLYATLYVLLNLEAYSLLIGSLLLFAALAILMWTTRRIDWSAIATREENDKSVEVKS